MPRFWSLKLPTVTRFSMQLAPSLPSSQTSQRAIVAFFGTHALRSFQGPALISSVVRNVVAWQSSIWLSVLRQPARLFCLASGAAPSLRGLSVLRRSARHSCSATSFNEHESGCGKLFRPCSAIVNTAHWPTLASNTSGAVVVQGQRVRTQSNSVWRPLTYCAPVANLTDRSTRTSMLRMAAG